MRSKSQIFADAVFPNVQNVAMGEANENSSNSDREARKYKSLCKRAGSILRNSGLIQMLAFLQAKSRKESEVHHEWLFRHLGTELNALHIIPDQENLFDHARKASLPEYMYLTRETLHLLNWHKRFSETLIAGNADD